MVKSATNPSASTPTPEIGPQGFPTEYYIRDVRITPNVVLAPMEGVTDIIFRRLIRALGRPGLTYTEFIASKNLTIGERRAERMARFDDDERPVALQIYGKEPELMAEAARILEGRGATILDINMGCPSKAVCKNSGGSALMRDPELATEIVRAVRAAISIPLTVKMRSGFDHTMRNAPELARRFELEGAEGITIHWRTREDKYGGTRAIDKIAQAVDAVSIPVIANGDIIDIPTAQAMFEETGCAGVMLGRGAIRNPWAIHQIGQWLRGEEVTQVVANERERGLLMYFDAIEEELGDKRALGRMKMVVKHFADSLPEAKTFRKHVLRSQTREQAREHVHAYFELLRRFESGETDVFASSPYAGA